MSSGYLLPTVTFAQNLEVAISSGIDNRNGEKAWFLGNHGSVWLLSQQAGGCHHVRIVTAMMSVSVATTITPRTQKQRQGGPS